MTQAAGGRIAIVGGGFTGSLLALRLAGEAGWPPVLIERHLKAGPGLAYGAADWVHALNVTVQRMDVGLSPGFEAWLAPFETETAEAKSEAGSLAQAFVPRRLFGQYMAEQVDTALKAGRIQRLRGEVVRLRRRDAGYELWLADGRSMVVDHAVLATGNLPPARLSIKSAEEGDLADHRGFIADPWMPGAMASIASHHEIVLVGSGLTAVDVVLSLQVKGHKGAIHLLSRHGLLPRAQVPGGEWPPFLAAGFGRSPAEILKVFCNQVAAARRRGIPWQRVIDASRMDISGVWANWDDKARAQFLRHGRTLWDVHRHRMPQRIANRLIGLVEIGQLRIHAARLQTFIEKEGRLRLYIQARRSRYEHFIEVDHVINCTGAGGNFAEIDQSFFADLRQQGLIQPNRRHLGIETDDTKVIDVHGQIVPGLYAVGSLTRPALWEITAVPDIAIQVDRLVAHLLARGTR